MAEKKYIDAAAILPLIPHIDGETTIQCVERAISHVPAADVVEVRHGEWKSVSKYAPMYSCSACGKRSLFNNGYGRPFSYFPECGTKMDGGKTE